MIITSLLDTDLYKFTMQQAVWHQFPDARAEYVFRCRAEVDLTPLAAKVRQEIDALAEVHLTDDEAQYLRQIRYLKNPYVESLKQFRFDPADVHISTDGGQFALRIRGGWYQSILWEVPILAIVNQTYFQHTQPDSPAVRDEGTRRLHEKCEQINQSPVKLGIIEFGTRRRYSRAWQEFVTGTLKERIGSHLLGTSNVDLARRLNLKPFGTMAHEFLQAGQALAPLHRSQTFALEAWMQEYRGDLGIALSDVVGMDAFLRDFDLLFSKAYDGARHDSGDPMEWGEKLVAHYEKMGIDPRTKSAVFSDNLNIPRVIEIARRFEGRIRTSFGIGTNLTNDLGFKSLPIVLKLVRLNGLPVAKISDEAGKTISEDPVFLAYLRQTFAGPTAAD